MFKPTLGVSLHTISNEVNQALLDAVDESRIATIEIYPSLFDKDKCGEKRALLKETLCRSQIRAMTIHALFGGVYDLSILDETAYGNAMAHLDASLGLAVDFDAPMIVVHASAEPIEPAQRGRRMEQSRRALTEIGARCELANKRIAIELLPRTCLGNTVEELLEIMDGLDETTFGVCLDTNHLMNRFQILADCVRTLGGRLFALHLSDYDGVDEKHQMPGKGVIDWKSFMAALREINYAGPFNYECQLVGETPKERVESVEKNFDWLRIL